MTKRLWAALATGLRGRWLSRLNNLLTILKRHRPTAEICTAFQERITRSPLDQFNQTLLPSLR
jgi:hypothetical protein